MQPPTLPPDGPAPPPIDDDERAFRASFARMVEWYRVGQTRVLLRAFGPAFALLPLGSLLIALTVLDRYALRSLQPLLTIAGILVTASGPLWAIVNLLGAMRRDLYVAIRVDGLCVRLDPRRAERVVPWDSVVEARYDASAGVIAVSLADGESLSIGGAFTELDLPALSRRIMDARRLAVWNRLLPHFACADASE